jgi:hypothetical protein
MSAWFWSLNLLEVTGLLVWAMVGFWGAFGAWLCGAYWLNGRQQIRKLEAAARMREHEREARVWMNEVAREFYANQGTA